MPFGDYLCTAAFCSVCSWYRLSETKQYQAVALYSFTGWTKSLEMMSTDSLSWPPHGGTECFELVYSAVDNESEWIFVCLFV